MQVGQVADKVMKKTVSQSPLLPDTKIIYFHNVDIIGKREHENNWESIAFQINETGGL